MKIDFFSLEGKKALITGGGSGIGLAIAKRFVQAGAVVALVDIQNCSSVTKSFGALPFQADVSSADSVKNAFESVQAKIGNLDILINNAGIGDLAGTIEEGNLDVWEKVFAVNVYGVVNGLKFGPRYMNESGSIINTASQAAYTRLPGYEPYATSKSAVVSLTKSAALELADRKIRVNAVCPTHTRTPMMEENSEEDSQVIKICAPLGKVAEVEDMVGVFHFLATDEAKFINGQSIVVDGGWTAGMTEKLLSKIVSG